MEKEKEKSLDSAMAQIVKSYGKGSIMKLGEQAALRGEITVFPARRRGDRHMPTTTARTG